MTWANVWEWAGILGIDPRPFTLRSLFQMTRARLAHDWDGSQGIWTSKRNPYRFREFVPMEPAELYAMQKAIERRKAK